MTPARPLTARQLLEAVAGFGPTPGELCLEFEHEPPPDLLDALRVLHTGVRSALTGRPWVGCSSTTGRSRYLSPDGLIPDDVDLLTVEGDARWDRIMWDARQELPHLFAAPPTPARGGTHAGADQSPGYNPAG